MDNSRHAAAIVYKNCVLATGYNQRKTHPLQNKFSKYTEFPRNFLHAEMSAIIRAKNLFGSDILMKSQLIVIRILKDGSLGYSKPCEVCQAAIKHFKIPEVYWSY